MRPEIHCVSLPSGPREHSGAQAVEDSELGLVAIAQADPRPTMMHEDLAGAAAKRVLQTLRAHIAKSIADLRGREGSDQADHTLEVLRTAVHLAAKELEALALRRHQEIPCTLDVALILDGTLHVAHIGDGAVFLLRKGLVHKLTADHVKASEAEGGRVHQTRAPRTRELGKGEPETLALDMGRSDRVLVASPWVANSVDDLRIREVSTDPSPDGVTARLLSLARERAPSQDLAAGILLFQGQGRRSGRPGGRLETLARISLFAYCTERELLALAGITRPMHFREGQVLFKQGETGKSMYLLVAGKVQVVRDEQALVELGPGASFGEMSLLDEPERSATVQATESGEALLITREAFFALLKREPTLAVKVLWNMLLQLSGNLRETSEKLAALEAKLK